MTTAATITLSNAFEAIERTGGTRKDLLAAISRGAIQVKCSRSVRYGLAVVTGFLAVDPIEDKPIYHRWRRANDSLEFVHEAEIRSCPDGLTQLDKPPYWHIAKVGTMYRIVFPSNEIRDELLEEQILGPLELETAKFFPDGTALVDDFEMLIRIEHRDVRVLNASIAQFFKRQSGNGKSSRSKPGRKESYLDVECNKEFQDWASINPMVDMDGKIKKLKEIYLAASKKRKDPKLKPLRDKRNRREIARIKLLLAEAPSRPN